MTLHDVAAWHELRAIAGWAEEHREMAAVCRAAAAEVLQHNHCLDPEELHSCQHDIGCDNVAVLCAEHGEHEKCLDNERRLKALLDDIAASPTEIEHSRYVVVQIDRDTWESCRHDKA